MLKKTAFIFLLLIQFFICFTLKDKLITGCLFLIADVILAALAVCYKKYTKYMAIQFPSIMVNRNRNYDVLLLGSRKCAHETAAGQILNLKNDFRNLYTDYLLVQRWYSLTRMGGDVVVEMDFSDNQYLNNSKINKLDYDLLHPVTLLEHGIHRNGFSTVICRMEASLAYFFKARRRRQMISGHGLESCYDRMEQIAHFCGKRGRRAVFHVFHCRPEIRDRLTDSTLNIEYIDE